MIIPTQQHNEIEQAMKMHIATLHDAGVDLLVALQTILLGFFSLVHAIVRIAYASIGFVVWALGVWLVALQYFRAKTIEKSSTSPFRAESEVLHE
jgi:hypothetical protein